MHVVVCTKLVPTAGTQPALNDSNYRLDRSGELALDDADSYGVEVGLRLTEQAGGGEVTLLSMAPDVTGVGLRTALAMGAARAVVVSDPCLIGSDALGTAKVLAAAVRRLSADLIVAATESTDGYTGTVPVQIAELLGIPSVSFARRVEVKDGTLIAERQTENGYDEISCLLPAVVTVTAGVVEVRYPSIRGVLSARSKPIDVLSLADLDLDLDPTTVGEAGARQRVVRVDVAPTRGGGRVVIDDGSAELEIVELLKTLKVL